jgi:hypothetical protein
VSHRRIMVDHCVLFGLSTEYWRFSITFTYRVLFYANDMKLFLPVKGRFSRTSYPIEFSYILAGNVLDRISLNTPRYRTRGFEFLPIGFHRTNYVVYEPMSTAMHEFNEVIGLFDFLKLTF